MRNFFSPIFLLLYPFEASASNMGNGPATICVWVLGGCISFIVALNTSSAKDVATQQDKFDRVVFFNKIMKYFFVVFMLGIVAFFF